MKKRTRLTMREAIFYQLLQNLTSQTHAYIPVFDFMGDVMCDELTLGGFVSHEVSPRLSEINRGNPGLLQVQKRKAKYSPATYHCYRISPAFVPRLLQEKDLQSFYERINARYTPQDVKPKRVLRYDPDRNCMVEIIN